MSIKNIVQKFKNMFSGKKNLDKLTGTIKFFNRQKRFGFIIADTQEYFFHAAATNPSDFKALKGGVIVKFNVVQGIQGLQADNIEII